MHYLYILALITVLTCTRVNGYPNGAPYLACQEMKPYHPPTTTTGTPPFKVNLTETYYKLGSEIKGVLFSPTGVEFRGFLIEARSSSGNDSSPPLGAFINLGNDSQTVISCGEDSKQALTHTSNSNKTEVEFTWFSPTTAKGDIHFKVTAVESYSPSRYWMGILSDVIEDCSIHTSPDCDNLPTVKPTTPTTPGSTTPEAPTTSDVQPITTSDPGGGITFDPDCGKTKGCFPDCSAKTCEYLVTWQAITDKSINAKDDIIGVRFVLQMVLANMENIWIAIGLSPEGNMDKTNVAACLSQSSGLSMQSSHNVRYTNVMFDNADQTFGLSEVEGSTSNGIFSCTFTREKAMNMSDYLDLDRTYYLLVATGPESGGTIQQHVNTPVVSSSKINFTSYAIAEEDNSVPTLIKLHASLMVVAWVFFSSVGIVSARHCKDMLALKLLFKLKYWFVVHRTFMTMVLMCVIAAFVAIFVEKGRFSEITTSPGQEYEKAHPFMGIVVTAFTCLNPLMALFRPGPDHKNRYIFNWAHFGVGTTAHILAVVTIFFGLDLEAAKVNRSAFYVMVTYAAIFVIVQTILECYNYRRKHRKNDGLMNGDSFNFQKLYNTPDSNQTDIILSRSPSSEQLTTQVQKVQTGHYAAYILVVHCIVMFALAGFLVAIICMPSQVEDLFGK